MRGQQTITSIFPPAFEPDSKNKGKRSLFNIKRDECLCYRFYFRYHILESRFDVAVAEMEEEFWITGSTIVSRLTVNDTLLKQIVKEAPSKNDLRRKYPHFSWQ